MPALLQPIVGLTFRALVGSLLFVLTLLRRVYTGIQDMNNMDDTMPGSRLSLVTSSSIRYRPAENNKTQKMTGTPLAIENIPDTALTHESIEGNNENGIRNEEQKVIKDDRFSQVALNSNENQLRSAQDSSVISINSNDENMQAGNQNNTDEMIVTALAFVLECCDMCVIL